MEIDIKTHIEESRTKCKKFTKDDWQIMRSKFEAICLSLRNYLKKYAGVDQPIVQALIKPHYKLIQDFWTPHKGAYSGLCK